MSNYRVLRIFALVLAAVSLISLSACGGSNKPFIPGSLPVGTESSAVSPVLEESSAQLSASSEKVSDDTIAMNEDEADRLFSEYLTTGAYMKAVELYTSEYAGNMLREAKAQEIVDQFLLGITDKVYAGEYSEAVAQAYLKTAKGVFQNTDLSGRNYSTVENEVNAAVCSRANYLAATEFEALGKYSEAIASYKSVNEKDKDYVNAQNGALRCAETYKSKIFASASDLVKDGEYSSALMLLETLKNTLPEDSEVLAKISVYTAAHIESFLDEADRIFLTPKDDYEKALTIINEGLQHYPKEEKLLRRKEYYSLFRPVSLLSKTRIDGKLNSKSSDTDMYNNDYTDCFYTAYSWNGYVVYDIDKQYNVFTATLYGQGLDSSHNYTIKFGIKIFGDDMLIYENKDFRNNSKAINISCNVTGISELKIQLYAIDDTLSYKGIGITNMMLQKTER